MNENNAYPLACAYLEQIREADRNVNRLRSRLFNLRMLTTDTSVHLTDMPHSGSPDQQKLATLLAKIDELERQIPEAEQAARDIRYEVGNLIDEIPNEEAALVMIHRYVDGKPWQQIISEIGFATTKTYALHEKGLAALEEILSRAS